MSSVHRIKLLILGLLLFPAALFAQTSTTGRIDEGPLAARPTICTPGDYYVSTDTNPVVEYKCSIGNNWNIEAGGGGGGAPGGNNGDTQCKSGTTFVACSNNSEIRYVCQTGNDTNSGLTWDTCKATVFAALEALPNGTTSPPQVGNGTVVVGDNVWWNPDHTKGLWVLDTNDPNYSTPPAGWIRGVAPTFWPINIIGQGCGTLPGGNANIAACVVKMSDFPGVGNGGTNNPAIWLAGPEPTHIENISASGNYGRCMALGIDSTGNRSNTATAAVNKSFQNMTCAGADGVDNTGKGRGPVIDIGPAFFDTFDKVFASKTTATNQSLIAAAPTGLSVTGGVLTVTFTAANTAFFTGEGCGILGANSPAYNFSVQGTPGGTGITVVDSTHITMPTSLPNGTSGGGFFTCDRDIPVILDAGTTAAGGEIIYRDATLNGGGIKQRGGQLTVRDVTTEGDFTHCIGPVIWFIASGGGLGQGVIADYIAESDQCPTVNNNAIANPVKVEGAINSDNIQITSTNEFPYTEGSLTYRGDSGYGVKVNPLTRPEWGVVRGHLAAQTDVAKHAPLTVRYPNFEHPTSANWTTTGLTIVNGLLDNDGGTNAVSAVPTSGTATLSFSSSDTAFGTWNVGDIGICGVWMKSTGTVDPYQGAPAINISCSPNGGTTGYSTCNLPVVHGDGQWDWYWCVFIMGTGSAASASFSTGTLTTSTPIVVYAPTFFRIPVADGVTFNEAVQMAYDVRSTASTWPSSTGCVAGTTCDAIGPLPHVGVATGNTNCVADWLSQTSLGQLCSAVTGQPLISVNGSAPTFSSPGIQDGNSGSAVTTTPYTIQCDSATTLVDRAHILRFQPGAASVTIPLSTAIGCLGGFVVSVVDDGAGTITINRTSPDTFTIVNGGSNVDGATSFSMTNGQFATINQGAPGIWEVRLTGSTGSLSPAVQPATIDSSGTFTITSGSPNVTDTNVTFTQANVGNLVAASTWNGLDTGYVVSAGVIASGTTIATVTDSHHIVLSANATGNAGTTNGNIGIFAYGPDGQPAVHTAVVNALTNPSYCGQAVILPAFPFFMSTGENTTPTCPGMQGGSTASKYGAIGGLPPSVSTILLPPGFTCPASPCFGGQQGVIWQNVTWNGLGQNINVITNNLDGKKFFATANDGTYYFLSFYGIDASNSASRTMSCVQLNGGYHAFSFITIDGCGDAGASNTGNAGLEVVGGNAAQTTYSGFVGNTGGDLINVSGTLGLRDWSYIMSANTASGLGINCLTGNIIDFGGNFINSVAVASSVYSIGTTCNLELNNVYALNNANPNSNIVATTGGAKVRFRDSRFLQGGATGGVFGAVPSTATVINAGNNIISGTLGLVPTATCTGCGTTGSVAFSSTSSNEQGNFAISAAGTGEAATGTVVITQLGTFTINGAITPCTYTLTQTSGSAAWAAGATIGPESSVTTTARTIAWTNSATALVAGNSYQVFYICNPR